MTNRWVVAVVAVIVLAVGGCGNDGEEGNVRARFSVTGTEMAFDAPESVKAGTYVVTFRNAGAVYHELAFRDPGGEFVVRRSIAGGATVKMEVDLASGTWELGCFEPGHYEAGMHRLLVVE